MEKFGAEYFVLEDEYSKVCKTNDLLYKVIALREEIPLLYEVLLKKEAKIWATKLQHPKVKLETELIKSTDFLIKTYPSINDFEEEASSKINKLNVKSVENKKIYQVIVKESERFNKIKEWLTLRKQ